MTDAQPPLALEVFEPPDGGVAEHVLTLCRGLQARGFAVAAAGPPEAQIYSELESDGIEVHRVRFRRDYRHPHDDVRAGKQLDALLTARQPTIVHFHASKAGAVGRVAAARHRLPLLYTPHCFGFVGDVGRMRRALVPVAERILGRVTDRIICVSEAEIDVARQDRIGRPNRLRLIRNGVPAPNPELRVDPQLAELAVGGPLLANIGVMRPQKRQDLFLEAARLVLARHDGVRLALVGSGPLEEALRQRSAELGLDRHPRFRLLSFSPPVGRYLMALDGFVLSSGWEALPISLLEALASGVPQVATAIDGNTEIVTPDTGVLVPPSDPEGLADGMLTLLRRDPEAMASASRRRHRALFTVEQMLNETAALYRELLGAGNGD